MGSRDHSYLVGRKGGLTEAGNNSGGPSLPSTFSKARVSLGPLLALWGASIADSTAQMRDQMIGSEGLSITPEVRERGVVDMGFKRRLPRPRAHCVPAPLGKGQEEAAASSSRQSCPQV